MPGRFVGNVWEYSDLTLFYRNDPSVFTESRVPNHKIQYYILSFIVKYASLNIWYNPIYSFNNWKYSFNNCIEYILHIITMSRNAVFFMSRCRVTFKYFLLKYNIVNLLSIDVCHFHVMIFSVYLWQPCACFHFYGVFSIMFGTCRLRAGWSDDEGQRSWYEHRREKSRLKLRTKLWELPAKFERGFAFGSLAV